MFCKAIIMIKRFTHYALNLNRLKYSFNLLLGLGLIQSYASAACMPETGIAFYSSQAQQKVTGVVRSSDGPLQSVTISVKENSSSVTSTDGKGAFTLNAIPGQTLVFSAVGFDSKEVLVTNEVVNVT